MSLGALVLLLWVFGASCLGLGILFTFMHEFKRWKKAAIILLIIGAVMLIILFLVVLPRT
jgi:uncharacterized membrane-anchored protein YitT (DUF2179 family)